MRYNETTLTTSDLTIFRSEPKTKPTDVKVEDFLNAIDRARESCDPREHLI